MFEAIQFLTKVAAFNILFLSIFIIIFGMIALLVSVIPCVDLEEDACDEEKD